MNLINRIVITLLLLALFAGAIAVIVLTWAMPDDSISGLRDAVDWLEDNNEDLQKALLTMIAALVALVCFTALVLEFVPSSGGAVKVTDVQTGQAVLTTAAIAACSTSSACVATPVGCRTKPATSAGNGWRRT